MTATELLLHQLDLSWQKGLDPKLKELLDEVDATDDVGRAELCAADLEWRWRTAKKRTSSPSAQDYAEALGEHWRRESCRHHLFESEWLVRSAWGDKPHIDSFVKQYTLSDAMRDLLCDQLDVVSQWTLKVNSGTEWSIEVARPTDLSVGRQHPWEPEAPAWLPEKRRLIVADLNHRKWSREQVRFRRVRAEEFEITNLSQRGALRFDRFTLEPLQTINGFAPLTFALNDLTFALVTASN